MREFILSEYKCPKGRPEPRIINTKNVYSDKTLTPGWDLKIQSEPKDFNAYSPPGGNQFRSTYKRLGFCEKDDHFLTTSQIMQNQIKNKTSQKKVNKPMIHYYTFGQKYLRPGTLLYRPDQNPNYTTTMQSSYQMPSPQIIPKLTLEDPPFLQNRKLRLDDGNLDANKFYDDDYEINIKRLQDPKLQRSVSFDPIKNCYTDGRREEKETQFRLRLPFKHV